MEKTLDLAVIGGGCVGLAAAYRISAAHTGLRVAVLEKEAAPAFHQTGRNSGVIHSGLYYKPGSYKAKNCIAGAAALVAFARENGVSHEVCGKIVVAVSEDELPGLQALYERGLANGLDAIKTISAPEIRTLEPNCAGIAGLHVPYTGIIDYAALCRKMAEKLRGRYGEKVVALRAGQEGYEIRTTQGTHRARRIVVCGGLQSDRLARMDGLKPAARIVAFRGDYYELSAKQKVRNLIYPVPDPAFPFLGVHLTRMTDGRVECGPNAVFAFKREGYGKTDFSLSDAWEALSFSGTRRLLARHWRKGWAEYRRAFSKPLFLRTLQRLVPSLRADELTAGRAGVRALAVRPDGVLLDDFEFMESERALHVLNAPSPAATACLAIGDEICARTERFWQ